MNIIELIKEICEKQLAPMIVRILQATRKSMKRNKEYTAFAETFNNCITKICCLTAIYSQIEDKGKNKNENLVIAFQMLLKTITANLQTYDDKYTSFSIGVISAYLERLIDCFEKSGVDTKKVMDVLMESVDVKEKEVYQFFKKNLEDFFSKRKLNSHHEPHVTLFDAYVVEIDKKLLVSYITSVMAEKNIKLIDLFNACLNYSKVSDHLKGFFEFLVQLGLGPNEKITYQYTEKAKQVTLHFNVITYAVDEGLFEMVKKFLQEQEVDIDFEIREEINGNPSKTIKFLNHLRRCKSTTVDLLCEVSEILCKSKMAKNPSVGKFIEDFIRSIIEKKELSKFVKILNMFREEASAILNRTLDPSPISHALGKEIKISLADYALYEGGYDFFKVMQEKSIPLNLNMTNILLERFTKKDLNKVLENIKENPIQLFFVDQLMKFQDIPNVQKELLSYSLGLFQDKIEFFLEHPNFFTWIKNGEIFSLIKYIPSTKTSPEKLFALLEAQFNAFQKAHISITQQQEIVSNLLNKGLLDKNMFEIFYTFVIAKKRMDIFNWLYKLSGNNDINLNRKIPLKELPFNVKGISMPPMFEINMMGFAVIWNDIEALRFIINNKKMLDIRQDESIPPSHSIATIPLLTLAILNYLNKKTQNEKEKKIAKEILTCLLKHNAPLHIKGNFFNYTPVEFALLFLEEDLLNHVVKIGHEQLSDKYLTPQEISFLKNRYLDVALYKMLDPEIIHIFLTERKSIDFGKIALNIARYFSQMEEKSLLIVQELFDLILIDYSKLLKKPRDSKEHMEALQASYTTMVKIFIKCLNVTMYYSMGNDTSLLQGEAIRKNTQSLLRENYITSELLFKEVKQPVKQPENIYVKSIPYQTVVKHHARIKAIFKMAMEFIPNPYLEHTLSIGQQGSNEKKISTAWSLLSTLCYLGFDEVLEKLLKNFEICRQKIEENVSEADRKVMHKQAFSLAIKTKNLRCAYLLFKHKLVPQFDQNELISPFTVAIQTKQTYMITLLLVQFGDYIPTDLIYSGKNSYLWLAIKYKATDIFKLLLDFCSKRLEENKFANMLIELSEEIKTFQDNSGKDFLEIIHTFNGVFPTSNFLAETINQLNGQLNLESDSNLGEKITEKGDILIKAKFPKEDQEKIIFIKKDIWWKLNEEERQAIKTLFRNSCSNFFSAKIKFVGGHPEKYGEDAKYKIRGISPGSGAGDNRLLLFSNSKLSEDKLLEDEKVSVDFVAKVIKHRK